MIIKDLQDPRIQFYNRPVRNTMSAELMSVSDVFGRIVGVQYEKETAALRAITDPKEHRAYKALNFDFVCFSGAFSYRKDDCLIRHSGLLCLDFDHLGEQLPMMRNALITDPYFETELLFVSPSGDGLKWVVEIDLTQCDHRTWFKAIQNYVRYTYHEEVDENCVNVSRPCYLPHDVHAYVNPLICPF